MDLLLVIEGDKSHYVYIKDSDKFMFNKTKNKNKKYSCKRCLQCFSSKIVLTRPKKDFDFKNYFKQIPVPFKISADFESNLESVKIYEGFYSKKYLDHVPCIFAYKVVCIANRFTNPIEVKVLLTNLLKQYLKSMNTVKK